MPKLYRPHIPLKVRVMVATRQCYERGFNPPAREEGESIGALLARQLAALAASFGCQVSELRLDHDPALGARDRRGEGKRTVYTPAANSHWHLAYRPHGPEYAGSHLIKTNVRGDHGQHPDRVLIKKARRLEQGGRANKKRPASTLRNTAKRPWPTRKFPSRRKP